MALTASGTARFFSILLLILGLAPWASIYALFAGFSRRPNHESFIFTTLEQETTLEKVFQNENATIEELWRALFRDDRIWKETAPDTVIHHWTIVLPWGISLAFGILFPLFLSLCSYMQDDYPLRIDPDDDPWISRHVKERSLYRLIAACERYRKVLVIYCVCAYESFCLYHSYILYFTGSHKRRHGKRFPRHQDARPRSARTQMEPSIAR
jgi:hypothetical protein